MFIGRREYIARLNEFMEDDKSRVACLFAQLGMGKSDLIKKFIKDKKAIYFTAYPNTDFGQLVALANCLGMKCSLPMNPNLKNPDKLEKEFDKIPALQDILDEITKRAAKDDFVFIIENYHNFIKSDPTFEGILHDYISKEWKKTNIKVVFTDESLLSLEKDLFSKKSIYKDLKVTRIDLGPLSISECKKAFAGASPADLTFLYGITGGIPAYVDRIVGSVDMQSEDLKKQAFMAMYFPEGADRALTPDDIMSVDLRELSYYNRILMTLAYGNSRVNQIAALVGKPKDIVVPYMKTLSQIGIVEKENAITEKTNRKKTRYSIKNTSFLFWYRYMAPNINLFYQGKANELWKIISKDLDSYMKEVFILMCRTYMVKKSESGKSTITVSEIGNWWVNDEEAGTSEGFDLVALGKSEGKSATIFTRCFYGDAPVEVLTLKDVIEVAKHMPSEGETFFVIFSKEGFAENALTVALAIKNIMLVTLEDVVKLV